MTGLSFRHEAGQWALEDQYSFYEPATEAVALRERVANSPHAGPRTAAERVLLADLLDCRRVCVANKPSCDGVYFSGLTVGQFIRFLESFEHDPVFTSAVRLNRSALDHMPFDVAFDYTCSPMDPSRS